ncbi:744_t:CDS:1 [Paraglomus brasilianum]|uniref:744_t:CDS:1 n=1 Tax=Paraglomus brasilianum TaxID=144538 RepID=A0A9N9BKW5_9GLOM|nr:744_t:CDS:1 [Paraglomus brasilianum]
MAFLAAALTLGPTTYTCIRCYADWPIVLIALGQLAPWSFKMFNDGARGWQAAAEAGGYSQLASSSSESHEPKFNESRDKFYIYLGAIVTVILSIIGWAGLTMMSYELHRVMETLHWVWVIYAVGLVLSPIIIITIRQSHDKSAVCFVNAKNFERTNRFCSMILMVTTFIMATFHIIGSHIILSKITNNWNGLAPQGAGMISAVIFFLGKRLLFFDIDCSCG